MDKIKVLKSKLEGEVKVSGAKNSALRLLAASILTSENVMLSNYPSSLLDAKIHEEMLKALGKECIHLNDDTVVIIESQPLSSVLHWEERSIRNTLLILGALTARTGSGAVPLPGGCQLGGRAYDLHEYLLKALGAEVWEENGMLMAKAPEGGLIGAEIYLPIRSTGATENAIIAGCLARGITRVWNPHIRPEIIDLVSMLNKMGAKIKVYGQEHIEIQGVEGFREVKHAVIPDNMEAITWLVGSVVTGGDVEIHNFPFEDLEVPLIHLKESGAKFYKGKESLIVRGGTCYPIEISTGPHPGINSDVQPIMAAFAACAKGESRIIDLRFPGRYGYAHEMEKMGLKYQIEGNLLKILGSSQPLKGANVTALDLRAGAALTLCGMISEGETMISDAWQIARGYNNFVSKIKDLNGNIEIIE